MASTSDEATVSQAIPPIQVQYCAVCSFPLEYCEFGSSITRCKEWLQKENPALYDRYYSEEAMQAKLGTLSLEAQSKLEKDTAKKEAKAEAKADAALKKKMASQITIKRIERNKRKYVTSIHGLEAFGTLGPASVKNHEELIEFICVHDAAGVDLKKASKLFAQKFATGASVTKNPQGQEEIVVQGDVSGEIVEMIEQQTGVLKGVPADNIVEVEEKKKKSAD
ncbi:hypothetical protein NM688_g3374 [Phlebia brevispora]|uniref:Uncharacterized protein n=1 Tax=Phlebia brevispora TaxID=194682 RepID=A0ACC1T5P9_9APHY|nr:hypothetical protein NM688_g3374 [Phlebia brevispora]